MKFTSVLSYLALAAATAAAPIAEEPAIALAEAGSISARGGKYNCVLHVQWTDYWFENALCRYRVTGAPGIGGSRNDESEMYNKWIDLLNSHVPPVGAAIHNLQYWFTDNNKAEMHVDISFALGNLGHNDYLNYHQEVLNDWRAWSNGCDVDSNL